MFGEMLQRGMAVAGWVIGFVAILGLFVMVVALICMLFAFVANGGNDEENEEEIEHDDTV